MLVVLFMFLNISRKEKYFLKRAFVSVLLLLQNVDIRAILHNSCYFTSTRFCFSCIFLHFTSLGSKLS